MIKRLRQLFCQHTDTYEEWEDLDTTVRQGVNIITSQQMLWECNTCGKTKKHVTKTVP